MRMNVLRTAKQMQTTIVSNSYSCTVVVAECNNTNTRRVLNDFAFFFSFCVEISHAIVMMILISGRKYAACQIRINAERESISHRELFDGSTRNTHAGGWLVGKLFAAGKLKQINHRNNDDDRRKKAKYVVLLGMDYFCTSDFMCVCECICWMVVRCVIALRFILSPFSSILGALACLPFIRWRHIFFPAAHTYTHKHEHTLGESTTTSTAKYDEAHVPSKQTHSLTHTNAVKRYYTNDNGNNKSNCSSASNMVDAIERAHAIFPLALATQCVGSHSIERFDSVRKFLRLRQTPQKLRTNRTKRTE